MGLKPWRWPGPADGPLMSPLMSLHKLLHEYVQWVPTNGRCFPFCCVLHIGREEPTPYYKYMAVFGKCISKNTCAK